MSSSFEREIFEIRFEDISDSQKTFILDAIANNIPDGMSSFSVLPNRFQSVFILDSGLNIEKILIANAIKHYHAIESWLNSECVRASLSIIALSSSDNSVFCVHENTFRPWEYIEYTSSRVYNLRNVLDFLDPISSTTRNNMKWDGRSFVNLNDMDNESNPMLLRPTNMMRRDNIVIIPRRRR